MIEHSFEIVSVLCLSPFVIEVKEYQLVKACRDRYGCAISVFTLRVFYFGALFVCLSLVDQ
jgi:hypothetical protein